MQAGRQKLRKRSFWRSITKEVVKVFYDLCIRDLKHSMKALILGLFLTDWGKMLEKRPKKQGVFRPFFRSPRGTEAKKRP